MRRESTLRYIDVQWDLEIRLGVMLTDCGDRPSTMPNMKVETEDGDVVLTVRQLEKAPYVVLIDHLGARGAAYNYRHKLVVPDVSAELLRFAKTRHAQSSAWCDEHDHGPRERASWMPMGSLEGWRLYWVRDSSSTPEHCEALPSK